jgi:hypothetical protein
MCGSAEPNRESTFEELRAQQEPIHTRGHEIDARGAFSCDFGLDLTKTSAALGAEIERDRIFLQRETLDETRPKTPGMIQKHIPFTPTTATSGFSGGRYLFEGRLQAAVYADYIKRRFVYPANMQFLQRPEFSEPECRDWSVVTAWNFSAVDGHTAMRTLRYDTGRRELIDELELSARLFKLAPEIVEEAQERGYAEVHLLHSMADHKVQLVYFVSRMTPQNQEQPDLAALSKISTDLQLGVELALKAHLTRVFDRSGLVLTIWQPYTPGDHGAAALWPNSPPIPGPACGDGVCVPSQGESGTACPADCTLTCGDAVCQPDETLDACPSDCRLPFVD